MYATLNVLLLALARSLQVNYGVGNATLCNEQCQITNISNVILKHNLQHLACKAVFQGSVCLFVQNEFLDYNLFIFKMKHFGFNTRVHGLRTGPTDVHGITILFAVCFSSTLL